MQYCEVTVKFSCLLFLLSSSTGMHFFPAGLCKVIKGNAHAGELGKRFIVCSIMWSLFFNEATALYVEACCSMLSDSTKRGFCIFKSIIEISCLPQGICTKLCEQSLLMSMPH